MKKARLSGLGEGRVARPSQAKQVVILGMGMSSYDFIRNVYQDNAVGLREVWTINTAGLVFKSDLNFNMHIPEEGFDAEADRKIIPYDVPTIMPRALEEMPNTLEYPLAEITEAFGENYFRNTVAYAVAYALWSGVESIELDGCDFNYRTTPGSQQQSPYEAGRCNVEYWLGFARAKGVNVLTGASTMLLDMAERINAPAMYGYGSQQPQFTFNEGKLELSGFAKSFSEVDKLVEA